MRRREAGITLVEVTAAITVVGIVIAILVPVLSRSSRIDAVMACRGRLRTLYEAQAKASPPGPQEFGSTYWARLARATPPLVAPETLRCPVIDHHGHPHEAPPVSYYGPAGDVSRFGEKDPLGSDMEGNHSDDGKSGGNILLRNGEVKTDHTGIWVNALRSGKLRP